MRVHLFLIERAFEHLNFFQCFLQLFLIGSFNAFANQFESISISNRAIVVIFVDIITEHRLGIIFFACNRLSVIIVNRTNQWRASQCDHNRFSVGGK